MNYYNEVLDYAMPATSASLFERFDFESSTRYQKQFQLECFRVFSKPKYRPCEYPVHEYLDRPTEFISKMSTFLSLAVCSVTKYELGPSLAKIGPKSDHYFH